MVPTILWRRARVGPPLLFGPTPNFLSLPSFRGLPPYTNPPNSSSPPLYSSSHPRQIHPTLRYTQPSTTPNTTNPNLLPVTNNSNPHITFTQLHSNSATAHTSPHLSYLALPLSRYPPPPNHSYQSTPTSVLYPHTTVTSSR